MDELYSNIEVLLQAIKKGEVYTEYKKQEENLKQDPELMDRVRKFRKNNFQLQVDEHKDEIFGAVDRLQIESAELRQNQKVNAYLDAELALCRQIQKVCRMLAEGIDMDIPE